MIESIVSISVGVTALLAALTLVTSSLRYSSEVDRKLVGAHLAAEGIEIVRNIVDANAASGAAWADGFSANPRTFQVSYDSTEPLINQSGNQLQYNGGTYSYLATPSSIPSGFRRDITTTPLIDPDSGKAYALGVSSMVSSAGLEPIVVEDYFYNWRQ